MRLIDFYHDFGKFLKILPPKHAKQIVQKILDLSVDPKAQDVKKLVGFEDKFRSDSGEYRIIFHYDNECLYVELVGKRNDDEVYKKFSRK